LRTWRMTFSSHRRLSMVLLVADRVQLVLVLGMDLADRVQPVVDQAAPLAVDGRRHAAAAVVAHDHHVLDLDHVDRELQHDR
jgi:hypothetical protein